MKLKKRVLYKCPKCSTTATKKFDIEVHMGRHHKIGTKRHQYVRYQYTQKMKLAAKKKKVFLGYLNLLKELQSLKQNCHAQRNPFHIDIAENEIEIQTTPSDELFDRVEVVNLKQNVGIQTEWPDIECKQIKESAETDF